MKWFILFLFCFPVCSNAQDKGLHVQGITPELYVTHTITAKESFYSIGRLYNISPKELAPFNNLKLEKPLRIGQILKVPLVTDNFVQSKTVSAGESLIPVYYTVKEKEGLYRIGVNHNKLSVDALKKMNNLKKDDLNTGAQLIIGYLKVKKDQAALIAKLARDAAEDPVVTTKEDKPIDNKKDAVNTIPEKVKEEKIDTKKEVIVKEEKSKTIPQQKENPKTVVKEEKKDPPVVKENSPVNTGSGIDFKGGAFKNLYESQTNANPAAEETGQAGVFKSTSGWNDGKYYCLLNNAPAGTIIKINNSANGKFVYAKVLDMMPDIKQNTGLLIRISNAAARELEAGENNFKCTINYSK